MPAEVRDWYDTPLYYDIIFDADTGTEGAFLDALWQRYGLPGRSRKMLEPACGSGRLVLEMARRGWQVTGFDGSPAMLAFARERLQAAHLKAHLWEDWMQSFTLPKKAPAAFDMAHCLVSTFKYLLTEADAQACLQRVADALKPSGLFVLGIHLTDYTSTRAEHERWVAQREAIAVTCNTHTWPADPRKRLERLRTRLRIVDQGRTHLQTTHWSFRTYSAAQLRALLRQIPSLELLACYDFTYDLTSPRKLDNSYADIVLVLKKTSEKDG